MHQAERATAQPGRWRERFLLALLACFVVAPFLFIWRGSVLGLEFVLYREPKLVAIGVVGWLLLAALLVLARRELGSAALVAVLRHPVALCLGLFIGYAALSLTWVLVVPNALYELGQYALLFPLVIFIAAWGEAVPAVATTIRVALIATLALATLVGALQGAGALPLLAPIDPGSGVPNPSLLGYKNPMALSLVGQLFVLLGVVLTRKRWASALFCGGLLVAELVYLPALQSRTSLLALGVGLAVVAVGALRSQRRNRSLWIAVAVALVASSAVIGGLPRARERARSAWAHLTQPELYLASDRGTYLRNTLHMVGQRPFGVGLGDWQTAYPVYRAYNRAVAFTDQVEVRRAHSDHVQVLGELGWPGLLLWIAFLGSLFLAPWRRFLADGALDQLLLAAQVASIGAAMVTDYFIEIPVLKLELFLVVGLVLLSRRTLAPPSPAPHRPLPSLAVALVVVAAGLQVAYHLLALERHVAAGALGAVHHAYAVGDLHLAPQREARLATDVLVAGRRFERGWGHSKTLFRDFLALSALRERFDDRAGAERAARRALALHPYSPSVLCWAAHLARVHASSRAAAWESACTYVRQEAVDGYARPYPDRTVIEGGRGTNAL